MPLKSKIITATPLHVYACILVGARGEKDIVGFFFLCKTKFMEALSATVQY